MYLCTGFNWMVGVLKKIMAEGTGNKNESNMPPMMEFFGPELSKVLTSWICPLYVLRFIYFLASTFTLCSKCDLHKTPV